ncbi:hypothetical protein FHU23_004206 [Clostridium saccharobutylicum]|uniref:Uncharacterized protein n=1 Tax=Clostridium saccharobutylicum DSM 13864 TaxID=1345695 RepID=U5MRD9_CLOSA|nr:hypothetical protein CLSA_c23900 [Clostridium saccharobutylicum DSM 13864]MBA2907525.1 hypothetical protein [Clostridium saccharobutylicum]MBA8792043.1 hypothetical protein [Clostridium saccharobutylicum]MBA8898784.1 hypothetical protein [Clostridium saccharobutylicum]MBA8980391.1 hypothetical protein [Clostridium saccharobutylicum]
MKLVYFDNVKGYINNLTIRILINENNIANFSKMVKNKKF